MAVSGDSQLTAHPVLVPSGVKGSLHAQGGACVCCCCCCHCGSSKFCTSCQSYLLLLLLLLEGIWAWRGW